MVEKRYNTYCDQNENRTVIDDDLNNTHIFIAYCEDLEDAIRLKIALNSVRDELNALHEENEQLKSEKEHYKKQVDELDGLLNKYEITFEELEEILNKDYRGRF